MDNKTKYVVLLRGINVGGKQVSMQKLKEMLVNMKFENVQTLLNSGNVVLQAPSKDIQALTAKIEKEIQKTFRFPVAVIIRPMEEVQSLVASNPFVGITTTSQTRLYVTFLSEKPNSKITLPYVSAEKDFQIISITDTVVCSALTLSEKRGTTDVMKILEKEFGKKITTRNWNTVIKIRLQ
jgi:uncharacterized protein (DUF1697 family)